MPGRFTITGLKKVREQVEREMKRVILLALDETAREFETGVYRPSIAELPTPTADAVEKWLQERR